MAKLRLSRERLTELTASDLAAVHAGVNQPTPVINTLPVKDCLNRVSLNCPTHQGTCYCPPPAVW